MPILQDPLEEKFAQSMAFGFTPSRAAVECGLGIDPVEAQLLTTRQDIKERIQELMVTQQFDTSYEHLRIARQLEMDREFAYEMGQPTAAINASVQRAKLLGVFVERTEQANFVAVKSAKDLTPEEWEAKFGGENA